MSRNTIRLILAVGTLSIIGILFTQSYWVVKNYELKEKEFDLTVRLILKNVAEKILKYNQNSSPVIDPVVQVQSDFFVVKVNDKIDSTLLKALLKSEFLKEGVKTEMYYTIYDCLGKRNEGSGLVVFDSLEPSALPSYEHLPRWTHDNYYFSIYFPKKDQHFLEGMKFWVFSTIILIVVLIFFSYVLFVVFQQKRLSEIQKDFINNMTHEFRTPLSTILISCEVLKDPGIVENPQRLNSYASIIQSQANRLNQQVERVLQMAKIDKGSIELKNESVNIHELIEEAKEKICSVNSNVQVDVKCHMYATDPILVGDRLHLLNIVFNLLDNAVKYCEKDPEIVITTIEHKSGIKISMADNGIGIALEHQKKIFDKFFRVPSGNLHNVKGFGLGLNYVRNIVNAHSGSIELNSELKKGSEFIVFLPRRR